LWHSDFPRKYISNVLQFVKNVMHLTKDYEVREKKKKSFPAHTFYCLMMHGDCIVFLLNVAYMLICKSLTVRV